MQFKIRYSGRVLLKGDTLKQSVAGESESCRFLRKEHAKQKEQYMQRPWGRRMSGVLKETGVAGVE